MQKLVIQMRPEQHSRPRARLSRWCIRVDFTWNTLGRIVFISWETHKSFHPGSPRGPRGPIISVKFENGKLEATEVEIIFCVAAWLSKQGISSARASCGLWSGEGMINLIFGSLSPLISSLRYHSSAWLTSHLWRQVRTVSNGMVGASLLFPWEK